VHGRAEFLEGGAAAIFLAAMIANPHYVFLFVSACATASMSIMQATHGDPRKADSGARKSACRRRFYSNEGVNRGCKRPRPISGVFRRFRR
jgi:hypothetical protein